MLIEINGGIAKLLEKFEKYNIAISLFHFGDHTYINSSDLINVIDDLLAEISRQEELIIDYCKDSDNQYKKMKDSILLDELDERIIQNYLYETDNELHITEDHYIDKEELIGLIQETTGIFKKQREKLETYKENYRPIGNESGWDVARCYENQIERLISFIEKKGLKEEYERSIKS